MGKTLFELIGLGLFLGVCLVPDSLLAHKGHTHETKEQPLPKGPEGKEQANVYQEIKESYVKDVEAFLSRGMVRWTKT